MCALLCVVALTTQVLAQEPPPIQYIYDDLSRLIKVIDRNGNLVAYVNSFVTDTDQDGVADVDEVALGTDPTNATSRPALTAYSAVVSG